MLMQAKHGETSGDLKPIVISLLTISMARILMVAGNINQE